MPMSKRQRKLNPQYRISKGNVGTCVLCGKKITTGEKYSTRRMGMGAEPHHHPRCPQLEVRVGRVP